MGLDIIAYTDLLAPYEGRDGARAPDAPFAGITLIGCYGGARFRGHAYVDLLHEATGHDPFDDVPAELVPTLAERLEAFGEERLDALAVQHDAEWWREGHLAQLRRWYRVCADHGYALYAGW